MSSFSSHHLISAYVDDCLSLEERADVEALLESSAEARAELESYRQLRQALKALPTEPAPSDLFKRVMAQAEQESLHGKPLAKVPVAQDHGSFRKRWTIPAASAIASLGLLLLVMAQLRPQHGLPEIASTRDAASNSAAFDASESMGTAAEPTGGEVGNLEVGALDGEEVLKLRNNLDLSEQLPMTESFDADGTMRMISGYDLRTARVGDVIDALQMTGDRVAVVQLTVLDRQRVLNSMHVLLSNLEVPEEARRANTYGERKSDFHAVYVEAGEGPLKELVALLQKDMDIEQMYVSRAIASAELNPFVAEQGYGTLWEKPQDEELAKEFDAVPAGQALNRGTASKAAEAGESNRPVRPLNGKNEEPESDQQPEKKAGSFRRAFVKSDGSKSPSPTPRREQEDRSKAGAPEPESAVADGPAPVPVVAGKLEYNYRERVLPLRIPEAVGKQLIAPQQQAAQLSMSNGSAAGRQFEKQTVDVLRNELKRQAEPSAPGGLGGGAAPSEAFAARSAPAAEQPRSAPVEQPAEPAVVLRAPKPGAAMVKDETQNESLADVPKRDSRPLRVLFLLTADTASAATPVPAANLPETKPLPQK